MLREALIQRENNPRYWVRYLLVTGLLGILVLISYYKTWTFIDRNDLMVSEPEYEMLKQILHKKLSTRNAENISKKLLRERTYNAIQEMTDEQRERFKIMGEYCFELSKNGRSQGKYSNPYMRKYDNIASLYMERIVVTTFRFLYHDKSHDMPKKLWSQLGDILMNIGEGKYNIKVVSNMLDIMDELATTHKDANERINHFKRQITFEQISKEIQYGVTPQKLNALFNEVASLLKPETIKQLPAFGELFISVGDDHYNDELINKASRVAIEEDDVDEYVMESFQKMDIGRFKDTVEQDQRNLKEYGQILIQFRPDKMDIATLNSLTEIYNKLYLLDGPFKEFRFLVLNLLNYP